MAWLSFGPGECLFLPWIVSQCFFSCWFMTSYKLTGVFQLGTTHPKGMTLPYIIPPRVTSQLHTVMEVHGGWNDTNVTYIQIGTITPSPRKRTVGFISQKHKGFACSEQRKVFHPSLVTVNIHLLNTSHEMRDTETQEHIVSSQRILSW